MTQASEASVENSRQEASSLSDAERIAIIRGDRWIAYERGLTALASMEELLSYPPRDRMPCLLIYGETGMGKTKILRKFTRDHPSQLDRSVGVMRSPVISFQMPASPDENQFYEELFRAVGSPVVPDSAARRTRDACRNLLRRCETRMLIIDEIHNMLSGSPRAQRVFLNTLRFLANDLRIPLVCAGTEEARAALLGDAQLAERFDPFELPRWTNNVAFHKLLNRIAAVLPLRGGCEIGSTSCRKFILTKTDGRTNRIFRLMEMAAVKAIEDGSERINEELLASDSLILPRALHEAAA